MTSYPRETISLLKEKPLFMGDTLPTYPPPPTCDRFSPNTLLSILFQKRFSLPPSFELIESTSKHIAFAFS